MHANIETLSVSADFSNQIEDIVRTKGTSYMDAVTLWCDQNGKEITVGAELVKKSPVIREKIKGEAEDLNLLPRTAKLPI